MKEELTKLESKLLNELIRPAIGSPYKSNRLGSETMAQDVNFLVLLKEIKRMYDSPSSVPWDDKHNWVQLIEKI